MNEILPSIKNPAETELFFTTATINDKNTCIGGIWRCKFGQKYTTHNLIKDSSGTVFPDHRVVERLTCGPCKYTFKVFAIATVFEKQNYSEPNLDNTNFGKIMCFKILNFSAKQTL